MYAISFFIYVFLEELSKPTRRRIIGCGELSCKEGVIMNSLLKVPLFLFLATAIHPGILAQTKNPDCTSNDNQNGARTLGSKIEILYKSWATETDKARVRSKLCAQSIKNLGTSTEEMVFVQTSETELLAQKLRVANADPAVIKVLLAPKAGIN
jgi:hypothetical protein